MKKYNKSYKKSRLKLFTKTYDRIIELAQIKKNDRVLDIGTESRELLKKIMRFSDHVTGIDVNKEAVKEADMPNFLEMNAINLKFKNKSFDKICSSHTIEHIRDLDKFFKEISRVLKPGGRVVLAYPFEIIRGSFHLRCGLFQGHKYHLHKLNPDRIKEFIKNKNLKFVKGGLFLSDFFIYPSWYTILEKPAE